MAQKAIVHKEGKVLIVRNHGEDIWDLPGGHLDQSEHPLEGICREIQEETGLPVANCTLSAVDTFIDNRNGEQYVLLIYTTEAPHTDVVPQEDELADIRWVGKEDLGKVELFPEYQKAVEQFFSN